MSRKTFPSDEVVTEGGDYLFVSEFSIPKGKRRSNRTKATKLMPNEVISESGPVVHIQGTAVRLPGTDGHSRRPKKSSKKPKR